MLPKNPLPAIIPGDTPVENSNYQRTMTTSKSQPDFRKTEGSSNPSTSTHPFCIDIKKLTAQKTELIQISPKITKKGHFRVARNIVLPPTIQLNSRVNLISKEKRPMQLPMLTSSQSSTSLNIASIPTPHVNNPYASQNSTKSSQARPNQNSNQINPSNISIQNLPLNIQNNSNKSSTSSCNISQPNWHLSRIHNDPIVSAPFPKLPSSKQIQFIISQIDLQISKLMQHLSKLESDRTRHLFQVTSFPMNSKDCSVQLYKNSLYPQKVINSVIESSYSRAQRSSSLHTLKIRQQFSGNSLAILPFFRETIKKAEEIIEPAFTSVTDIALERHSRNMSLTKEYIERRQLWLPQNSLLDEYHDTLNKKIQMWPKEFKQPGPTKTDQEIMMKFCAPDQRIFSHAEQIEYAYYDTNNLVENPVKEFNEFRIRNPWNETEKMMFLEIYAQHPRDFKRIAKAIPSKSIKDVIEYYDIHRIQFNLKQLEITSKKKRESKKVISEGRVKK